jgi:hypothetical protein
MCQLGEQLVPFTTAKKPRYGYRWCNVSALGALYPLTNEDTCWQQPHVKADVFKSWGIPGLHVFKSMLRALLDIPGGWASDVVLVKVKYWGLVSKHRYGVRASDAQIVAIEAYGDKRVLLRMGNPKLKLKFAATKLGLLLAR